MLFSFTPVISCQGLILRLLRLARKEAQMDEQERDHLLHQIRDLEQRHRRRKLVLLTVAAVLVLLGGVSFSTFYVVKAQWQQQGAERARAAWQTQAASATSTAVDVAKIDRTIKKEPTYGSQPYYVLLVFGPEAAKRVWLVLDGEVLYVDRNGNGDLTEAGKRVPLDVEASKQIHVAPGAYKATHVFPIGELAGLHLSLHFWARDKSFVP